jgi:membrane-associated protease RseP (regulator of RpoE activity)
MPPMMTRSDEGHRGYLGVSTIELGEQLADYFGVHGDGGVLVTEVAKDSPAETAGLKAGDIILSVENSKISDPADLMRLIRAHDPEDKVDVTVQRRGQAQTLHAKLGESKDLGAFMPRGGHGQFRMMAPEARQHMMMMLGPQMHEHLQMMERHEGGSAEI